MGNKPKSDAPKKSRRSKPVEEEPEVDDDEEEEPDETAPAEEGGEEEAAEEGGGHGLSEEARKKRKRDSTARAKQRGYRLQATRAGIHKKFINQTIASVEDVRRAGKWRPQNLNVPPYTLDEFKRRLKLSTTPFPDSAAEALLPHYESLLRTLVDAAVAKMVVNGQQTLRASHLYEAVAPLEKLGNFTFLLPEGLKQFSQSHNQYGENVGGNAGTSGGAMLHSTVADMESLANNKAIKDKMKAMVKEADAVVAKLKAARAEKKKKAAQAAEAAA